MPKSKTSKPNTQAKRERKRDMQRKRRLRKHYQAICDRQARATKQLSIKTEIARQMIGFPLPDDKPIASLVAEVKALSKSSNSIIAKPMLNETHNMPDTLSDEHATAPVESEDSSSSWCSCSNPSSSSSSEGEEE